MVNHGFQRLRSPACNEGAARRMDGELAQKSELKWLVDIGVSLAVFNDPESQQNKKDKRPGRDKWCCRPDVPPIRKGFDHSNKYGAND